MGEGSTLALVFMQLLQSSISFRFCLLEKASQIVQVTQPCHLGERAHGLVDEFDEQSMLIFHRVASPDGN
jgi:hypothetical protein